MNEDALDYWEEYKATQFRRKEDQRVYADKKVQDIVVYAYANVPFYRDLYDKHNIDISAIKTTEDLVKLPLVDKSALTSGMGGLSTEQAAVSDEKLFIKTSGSTGMPMSFMCDREQLNRRWAAWMRLLEWTGWQWGNKEIRFWFEFASTVKNPEKEAFDAYLSNRHFHEFDKLDEEELKSFCELIKDKEPYVITGYWEAIEAVAKYAYKNNIFLNCPAIIPTAQIVSETGRKIAEKVFGGKVYDKYASAEFSGIGYQCEQQNLYHVHAENLLVEVLKDGKRLSNGIGEAVVTDFSNRSTPLIRYRIGDVIEATTESCLCTRTLPAFKKPHGRLKNLVKIGNKLITEAQLTELEITLWDAGICDRIKFVQLESEEIVLLAAAVRKIDELEEKLFEMTGEHIKTIVVDSIEHFRGKRHRGESKLTNPYNN